MLNLRRVFKNYNETGSFNEQINLRGFIDSSIFQTKTGDVGVIRAHSRLGIRSQHHALQGVGYGELPAPSFEEDDHHVA